MGQKILITGGTGSLGSRIVKRLFDENCGHTIIIFSRDEQKQFKMRLQYESNTAHANSACLVKFVIGNVQDRISIDRVMDLYKPDIVIHTAAYKHVRVCDENPEQAILTNITGTSNIVDTCIKYNVQIACFISTDKAVAPTTLYGMTKAIAEQVIVNAYIRQDSTYFVGVRYGNVINSEGSLIPLYQSISESNNKIFKVTNKDMTRFFISFDTAIDLILYAISTKGITLADHNYVNIHSIFGNVFFIPKLKSAKIIDIASLFAKKCGGEIKIEQPYPTEKIHESMAIDYSSDGSLMNQKELKQFLNMEGFL